MEEIFGATEFNYLAQQNARGNFAFTGSAGADFADFLLGVPDTATLAFGNADKYFRESVYDGYVVDDWRLRPELSLNLGVRWEYGAPITELYGRLVNLEFCQVSRQLRQCWPASPTGTLTGEKYPASLVRPDKQGVRTQNRDSVAAEIGIVTRGAFGDTAFTTTRRSIKRSASQMAQQSPLSKRLSLQSSRFAR